MPAIFFIVLFGGIFAAIYAVERRARARREAVLAELGRAMGETPAKDFIAGALHGQPLSFRFTHRGSGKSRRPWTEIDVAVPPGQLAFALREETATARALRDHGMVVDVQTGDELFDDAFIVEAAPADVARALLDQPMRAALLAARPFAIVPTDGRLRLEVPGHVDDPARGAALADLAARLAAGYRPAHAAADAALEAAAPREGSPYRAERDAEPVRAAKRARLDELAHLAAVTQRRKTAGQLFAVALIVAVMLFYAILMLDKL